MERATIHVPAFMDETMTNSEGGHNPNADIAQAQAERLATIRARLTPEVEARLRTVLNSTLGNQH